MLEMIVGHVLWQQEPFLLLPIVVQLNNDNT